MPISPEKNDVDISRLFYWGDKFSIKNRVGGNLYDCYMRIIGDADLNRARVYALRNSAALRARLKDKNSEERQAFLLMYDLVDENKLIDVLVYMSVREITLKSLEDIDVPFPKEPDDDATLEEQEKYQYEVDNWENTREQKVRAYIDAELQKIKNGLVNLSKEELYKIYEEKAIEELCQNEMLSRYKEFSAFCGAYKDEKFKERLFSSLEEFNDLPTDIKNQFVNYYSSLELSVDSLKK